jgi:hypothetical protein
MLHGRDYVGRSPDSAMPPVAHRDLDVFINCG